MEWKGKNRVFESLDQRAFIYTVLLSGKHVFVLIKLKLKTSILKPNLKNQQSYHQW
jgi:hypothetical protein